MKKNILLFFILFNFHFIKPLDKELSSFSLKTVAILISNVVIHELGHACAGKILNNHPIDIHIGDGDVLYKLPGLTIHSKDFHHWYADCHDEEIKYNQEGKLKFPDNIAKLKFIATVASGPLAGMLTVYLIKKKLDSKNNDILNNVLKLMCKLSIFDGFVQGFCPIYPVPGIHDGSHLWQAMFDISGNKAELLNKKYGWIYLICLYSYVGLNLFKILKSELTQKA